MSDNEDKNQHKSDDEVEIDEEEYDKQIIPNSVWQKDHTDDTVKEIEGYQIKSRPLIKIFGKPYKLNEADANEKMQDIKQTLDPFNMQRNKVIDIGLQGCNRQKSTAAQTVWNRKINKSITVEDDIQKLDIEENDDRILNFLQNVQYEIEQALQSNETIDIFQNDLELLTNDDMSFGNDAELSTQIKEWKSFFYNNCRGKKITNIQFQPSTNQHKSKYIAASFMENLSFDDRIVFSYKSHKNMIVLWDYDDQHSIDPVMILVSPLEILCFAFNPKDPFQVVGGAINGQIIMWDLKQTDKMSGQIQNKKGNKSKQDKSDLVEVQPLIMSHLQDPLGVQTQSASTEVIKKNIPSHKNPVLSLQWLPPQVYIDKKQILSVSQPPANEIPHQFATISCDGQVLVWDNKFGDAKKPITDLSTVTWKAMFGIQLFRPLGGGQMGGAQLAFRKNQKGATFTGTSDEGEVFYVDWSQRATEDGDKVDMVQQFWQNNRNYRPTVGLDVSPFFDDIILTLQDFNFQIWKHDVDIPIFESNTLKGAQITCGCFSPSRPGVVMIGRTDGNLDIWDFLDQSHKATMQFLVISKMLTCMKFNDQHLNNLAVGDIDGSLHIIEIPTTLARKLGDEEKTMEEFWDREVQRVHYFKERFDLREKIFKAEKTAKEKQEQSKEGQTQKEDEKKDTGDDALEKEYQEFAQQYISEVINKEPPKEKPEEKDKKK